MRKGLKKSAAFLLAVCMIFSLFAGMPMSVKAEDAPLTRLLVTDCIAGADFVQGEGAEVTYSTYITADVSTEDRLYLKYANTEEDPGTPVTAGAIEITKDGQSAEGKASVKACEENPNFCDFTFRETGDYVVTYTGEASNNAITIHVHYPLLGFYKENEQNVENFIRDFSLEGGKDNTVHVIPGFLDGVEGIKSIKYEIEVDGVAPSLVTLENKSSSENPSGTAGATVTIAADATGDFVIEVVGTVEYEDAKKEADILNASLSCHGKMTGLVAAWPDDGNDDGPFVTGETEYGKYWELNSKVTHVLYFGTKEGEGTPAPYTGTLTITKVDGTTDADTAIIKHEENDAVCDGFYDVYFSGRESGTYRITAEGGSYITVNVVEPNAGFFSSSDIGINSYLDEQEMTFSESSNRTFYFAYKEKLGDDITLEIVKDENRPMLETNGNSDQVNFKEISKSGEYTVYQITLGENFEISYCDDYDFVLRIRYPDENEDSYGLILHSQREGFVYTWPQWDDKIGDANYYITPIYGFDKVGSHQDEKTILYFGKMDADGNVTPVRNVGDITAEDGASIEKYKDGIPGFYIVTLPQREKEYTFTCGGSKIRIYRGTSLIRFYTDEACTDEISDYTFFAGENKDFYVKLGGFSDEEENDYDFIFGKDENSKYNEENPSGDDWYFRINYENGESTIASNHDAPITIEQKEAGSDSSKSEKIYKISVKDNAPAQFGLYIGTQIKWDWKEEEIIQICKMKTEVDTNSTFKVDDQYVTIEEAPQPNDLVGEGKEGLTEEQKTAVEAGADLSVSIKADEIKVGAEGKVEVPENASNEVKQEIAKVQEAVDRIETTKGDKLSDQYETTYIDLTVNTVVKSTNGTEIKNSVTETKSPLIIKIPLPTELKDKGHYVVIRFHDGKSDILTATYDSREGYLTFETDRFSTYAIAYRETTAIDELDFGSVTWKNAEEDTFTYDGTTKTCRVALDGLPEGCTANLSGMSASATGEYVVNVDSITYGTTTYKASELAGKLPQAITDGYSWAIEKKSESGNQGGGTGGVPTNPTEPTEPTNPTEPTEPEETVQKGDIETVDGNSYQVTSVSATKKTVAYAGGDKKAKKVKVPSSIVIDGTTYKVTAIADNALSGYGKLTTVTIPSTVTKIGKNAFKNCTSLKSVTIPKNVTSIGTNAFYNCKKLTSVKFNGTKITKIGDGSFQKCAALKSVTVPASVKEIGKNAFKDCTKLSKITFKGTKITKIGKNAFANIAKKPVIAVPKSKKSAYKKLLDKAGYKKTVK